MSDLDYGPDSTCLSDLQDIIRNLEADLASLKYLERYLRLTKTEEIADDLRKAKKQEEEMNWLERQMRKNVEEVASWPNWMKKAANILQDEK